MLSLPSLNIVSVAFIHKMYPVMPKVSLCVLSLLFFASLRSCKDSLMHPRAPSSFSVKMA